MWLTDLRIVLPDGIMERGALRVVDGKIAEIIAGDSPTKGLPLNGLTAIPGIVDLHGDMLERDIQPRPGAMFPVELALYELDKRLAGSAVTTAYAAVGFAWTQNDLRTQEKAIEMIETIAALRHELNVDMRVHARFEVTNLETAPVLQRLVEANVIDLVSVMDHTPGQGQYKNIPKYVDFMTRWLGFDPEQIGADLMNRVSQVMEATTQAPRDWSIVAAVTRIARARGIVIASHDDDTLEKVDMMADLGVTISEFPVTLEAAQEAKRRGMHIIMGAPNAYRGASTGGNLSAMEAIRAGVVDILASDYFPVALLGAAFKLAEDGVMPLHESMKLVSQYPAQAANLHDRGQIALGKNADIALIESDGNTHPRVRATLRDGHFIYQDHQINRLMNQALSPKQQDELLA